MTAPNSSQIADWLQLHGIATLVLLIVAVVVLRASRPMVHRALLGVVRRRRARTAEAEPTADELAKRVATIEDLVASAVRFAVIVATLLVLLTWVDLLPVIAGFGVIPHFESMQRGVVDLRDVIYFASLIGVMLFATQIVLTNKAAR